MIFLLDTNVLSEFRKPSPHPGVMSWFKSIPEDQLSICVLTLGEFKAGISKLPAGAKKADLGSWFEHLREAFRNQIYTIDERVALKWGEIVAKTSHAGKPIPVIDGLIAACALANSATLVTRNVGDFAGAGVDIFNPWDQ